VRVLGEARMPLEGGSFERLFRLLGLAGDPFVGGKVRETVLALGTCFPSGDQKDALGATVAQVQEICSSGGLTGWEGVVFTDDRT